MKTKILLTMTALAFAANGCMQPSPYTPEKYKQDYSICHEQTEKAAEFINVKLDNFLLKDLERSVTENCMKKNFGWTDYKLDNARTGGAYILLKP